MRALDKIEVPYPKRTKFSQMKEEYANNPHISKSHLMNMESQKEVPNGLLKFNPREYRNKVNSFLNFPTQQPLKERLAIREVIFHNNL
jgi:hypothetical protein